MPLKFILFGLVLILIALFIGSIPFRKKERLITQAERDYAEALINYKNNKSEENKNNYLKIAHAYFTLLGISEAKLNDHIQKQLSALN